MFCLDASMHTIARIENECCSFIVFFYFYSKYDSSLFYLEYLNLNKIYYSQCNNCAFLYYIIPFGINFGTPSEYMCD